MDENVTMAQLNWTKPYCGVQHLKGHAQLDHSPRGAQVTVNDLNGLCATLQRWLKHRNRGGLKAIGRDQRFDTVEEARAAGEKWFKEDLKHD